MSLPIDVVLAAVRTRVPGTSVARLAVTHPADDDHLWFLRAPGAGAEVQLGSAPDGRPPFLVEGPRADQRVEAATVGDAIEVVVAWLT